MLHAGPSICFVQPICYPQLHMCGTQNDTQIVVVPLQWHIAILSFLFTLSRRGTTKTMSTLERHLTVIHFYRKDLLIQVVLFHEVTM